jgi:ATP synthase protein I
MHNQSCWSNKLLLNSVIKQLLFYQAVVLLLTIIIFSGLWNKNAGVSALLGGLAWLLPNFYFTRRVFAAMLKENPHYVLKEFYVAEFYKLFFSAVLLILIFKLLATVTIPLITGYIIALFSCWIISICVIKSRHL